MQIRASLPMDGANFAGARGGMRSRGGPALSMQGKNVAGIDFEGPLRGIPVTRSALVEVRPQLLDDSHLLLPV